MKKYKLPSWEGKSGVINHGYARLVISNGITKVDEKNASQMALVEEYGGVEFKEPPKPKAIKKKVEEKTKK